MKKTYSKPEIMFECFAMNTNIAANCDHTFGLYSKGICGIEDDTGKILFTRGAEGSTCTLNGSDEAKYNELCYHVPIEDNNLFNS